MPDGCMHLPLRVAAGCSVNVYGSPAPPPEQHSSDGSTEPATLPPVVMQLSDEFEDLVAVDQQGDWLKVEEHGKTLGWAIACMSELQPRHFPALFRFSATLPAGCSLRVRSQPDVAGKELKTISSEVLVYGNRIEENGKWLRVLLPSAKEAKQLRGSDGGDGDENKHGHVNTRRPSSPLEAWMMCSIAAPSSQGTTTPGGSNGRPLLVPIVPTLYKFSPDLPVGCSLRVRSLPRSDAVQFAVLPYGTLLPVVASKSDGLWLRIVLSDGENDYPEAWMMAATADGMKLLTLLEPASYKLSPVLPAGCSLRIRSAADSNSETIGTISGAMRVKVIDRQDNWLQILHGDCVTPAWMMSTTGANMLLIPADAEPAEADAAASEVVVATEPPSEWPRYFIVSVAGPLRIRSAPNGEADAIGDASKGEILRGLSAHGQWVRIHHADHTGDAWIMRSNRGTTMLDDVTQDGQSAEAWKAKQHEPHGDDSGKDTVDVIPASPVPASSSPPSTSPLASASSPLPDPPSTAEVASPGSLQGDVVAAENSSSPLPPALGTGVMGGALELPAFASVTEEDDLAAPEPPRETFPDALEPSTVPSSSPWSSPTITTSKVDAVGSSDTPVSSAAALTLSPVTPLSRSPTVGPGSRSASEDEAFDPSHFKDEVVSGDWSVRERALVRANKFLATPAAVESVFAADCGALLPELLSDANSSALRAAVELLHTWTFTHGAHGGNTDAVVRASIDRPFASRPVVQDLAIASVVRISTLGAEDLTAIRLLVDSSDDVNVKISAACLSCLNNLAQDHVGSTQVCDMFDDVCTKLEVCLLSRTMSVCNAALPLVSSLYALKGDELRERLHVDGSPVLQSVQELLPPAPSPSSGGQLSPNGPKGGTKDSPDAKQQSGDEILAILKLDGWKAREEAYQDIAATVEAGSVDATSAASHAAHFAQCLMDPNVRVISAVLTMIYTIVTVHSSKGVDAPEVAKNICERVLTLSSKPAIQKDASRVLTQLITADSSGNTLSKLISCIAHRNPKVSAGSINMVFHLLDAGVASSQFPVLMDELCKTLHGAMADGKPPVRDACLHLLETLLDREGDVIMDKCNVSKLPSPAKTQIEKLRARRDKAERESVSGPQSPSGSISPSPPPKRAAPVLKNEAPLSSSKPIDGVDQTPDWAEIPNLGEYRGNWRRVTPPVPEAGADPLRGEGAASAPLSSEESESEDSEIGASVDPFQALSDEVTSWEDQEANSLTLFTPEKPNSWALDANTEKAMTPLTDTDIANIVDYSSDDDYDSLLTYLEDLEIQGSFKALRTNKVNLEMLPFLEANELIFLGVSEKAVQVILASHNYEAPTMPAAAEAAETAEAAELESATNSSPAASDSGAVERCPSPTPETTAGSGTKQPKPQGSPSQIPVLASRYHSSVAAKTKMSSLGQEHHSPPGGGTSSFSTRAASPSPSPGRSRGSRIPVPVSRRHATGVEGEASAGGGSVGSAMTATAVEGAAVPLNPVRNPPLLGAEEEEDEIW